MHACVDCGSPATDWSLRADAKIQIEQHGPKRGLAFSSDPLDYDPRCHPCHARYDDWGGRDRRRDSAGRFVVSTTLRNPSNP